MKIRTFVVIVVFATIAFTQEKVRVFVTDSQSWQVKGTAGGARPQTAEIIKTVNEQCPSLTVTNNQDKADYILTLDHEGGKGLIAVKNKWALFNKDGDVIGSGSTRSLGNSVKDACSIITKDRVKK